MIDAAGIPGQSAGAITIKAAWLPASFAFHADSVTPSSPNSPLPAPFFLVVLLLLPLYPLPRLL
eukprot:6662131-Pyramimonas_sp.AAC.1